MSAAIRQAFFLAVLLSVGAAPQVAAQQAGDEVQSPSSAVLLGGFNLDLSGEADQGYTRVDPSLDFFVTPRWAVGARAIHATGYGEGKGRWSVWSVGPHVSFFPFRGARWTLGTSRPYAHGGVAYTTTDYRGGEDTYRGLDAYAGLGLMHMFFAGVGVFGEATFIVGENYTYGNEGLDLRLGLSLAL
jgi:hypothetical protein